MGEARARKLAVRIKEIVAELLEKRVKDPRLGFVTLTDSKVTNDLRDATLFYTVLGDQSEQESTAVALESVKGLLRSEVGRQTGVRFTPTLTFVLDAVPENARVIDDLLRQAAESDAEVAGLAAAASYAGEADPYRRDDEQDESASVEDDASEHDASEDAGSDGDRLTTDDQTADRLTADHLAEDDPGGR